VNAELSSAPARRLRVACFGLRGFGNALVEELAGRTDVEVTHLHTRREPYPFGYYPCEPIEALCDRLDIPWSHVPRRGAWRPAAGGDLAVVSSFHRLFRRRQLERYPVCVNLHPSLLPDHRGATPITWAILAGRGELGVTAHRMTADPDAGPILFRERLFDPGLTDAGARRALAFLSRSLVRRLVELYPDYPEEHAPPGAGSAEPPRSAGDAVLAEAEIGSAEALARHLRAFTNYPMPKIRCRDGRLFTVDYERPRDRLEIEVEGRGVTLLGYFEGREPADHPWAGALAAARERGAEAGR